MTAALALGAAALAIPAPESAAAEGAIDFNRQIRPILSDNCFYCHCPDEKERKAKLRLDTAEGAAKVIDAASPMESEFIHRITTEDADDVMPPRDANTDKTLKPAEIALLKQWVAEGAKYEDHWAFVPPSKPEPPAVRDASWCQNEIDRFVLARLEAEGLRPMPEAPRPLLLRRVAFDLTGLPPTPAEVDAFVNDASPNAYEKAVDRLLKSERYGERMALAWMDAARYGDTSVMHADGPRDMWPWRDWVIAAYNANMPFDRFSIEQIAGDLIPEATPMQKVASGFNRNHATSDEGGAIPEELRVEYVVDRVKTTSNVWLALSMECGQCHEHKYDPISQKEYYQFFAYFNNTKDPGMQTRNGNQSPVVEVMTPEREAEIARSAEKVAQTEAALAKHKAEAEPQFAEWLAKNDAEPKDGAAPEPDGLAHFFAFEEDGGNAVGSALSGVTAALDGGKHQSEPRDKAGRALKLDGKTAFTAPSFPDVEKDQGFTFAAWLKLPKNANGAVFSRMNVDKAYRGYDFWVQNRQIGTHIVSAWPDNALKVVSKQALEPGKWQHVAVVYDGSAKAAGVRIYIDGKLTENAVEQDSLKDSIITDAPFRIGARSKGANLNGSVDDLRIYGRALAEAEIGALGGDPIRALFAVPAAERKPEQIEQLRGYYFATADKAYQRQAEQLKKLEAAHAKLTETKITSMIMEDNEKPRMTYVLNRGAYDQPIEDEVIPPGVPDFLPDLPADAPANRLGLARWLFAERHPLTGRVAANRYWAMLFGNGLVGTVSDFGNQGESPSHPELLDWLACDFEDSGWDVKRTLKQIVMSAAYRQDSRATPALLERDPQNRLMARGSRFRLQGEFIRDHALAVSGLLVGEVGGPGVKPYQPPNIWNEVSLNGGLRYQQDKGESLYRRSMYTYWKRSAPAPNMLIFDAPSREKCTVQRARTNTPLQALVTLNDPCFVEAARALAARMIQEGGGEPAARIAFAFRYAVSRDPAADEVAILTNILEKRLAEFRAEPAKAEEFLKVGESPRPAEIDAAEHAAWSVVAQVILNLDEAL
ncbi:MAG: DUF1553 domain-containing protein, partial [Verrucomicrobiales bacterium]